MQRYNSRKSYVNSLKIGPCPRFSHKKRQKLRSSHQIHRKLDTIQHGR